MSSNACQAVPSDGRRQGASSMEVLYWAAPGFRFIQHSFRVVLHTVSIKPVTSQKMLNETMRFLIFICILQKMIQPQNKLIIYFFPVGTLDFFKDGT